MSKRTIEAYESAFTYIHENLIPLRGDAIIIDFEKAMRTGLNRVLSSIDSDMSVLGCWFHFCQALRRYLAKLLQLFEKVKRDERYYAIFRRIQCLPLLPLHHIEISFKKVSKDALKLDKELFSPFINYFHNEWMKKVTPYHFCVYMRGKRTTADAESMNAKVNALFRAHGGFFQFNETLQKLESATSTQLENYINGTQQKDTRSSFFKKRSKLIQKLSLEHKDHPELLLNALANPKNKALYAENEIAIEEEDVEMAASVELYGNENATVYKEVPFSDESDDEDKVDDAVNVETMASRRAKKKNNNVQISTRSRALPNSGDIFDYINEYACIVYFYFLSNRFGIKCW